MSCGLCGSCRRCLQRLLLAVAVIVVSTGNVFAQPVTTITGQCKYDSTLGATRCEYTLFVGASPVQQVFVPIPQTCASCVTATTPFFKISGPTDLKDPVCETGFGIYLTADAPVTKMAKATFVYDGICSLGVVMALARTGFTDSECLSIPVPGVVACAALPYIAWSVDATDLELDVRKAGTYAAQLLAMSATSNTNSGISFSNFGSLVPVDPNASVPIQVQYQVSQECNPAPPASFLIPDLFNTLRLFVPGTEQPVRFCLWGQFTVTVEHTPSEYDREAIIILQMENHEAFIDTSP